jgi:two-component system, NarL family, sensor histidine kinase DevS
VGLGLHGTAGVTKEPAIQARLAQAVDELDTTIGQIRTTIFDLHHATADNALRSRVKAVLEELEPVVGTHIQLALDRSTHSGTLASSPMWKLSFGKP